MSMLDQSLQMILKPELAMTIGPWSQTASSDEIKGLKVITAIINHKGERKFKTKSKISEAAMPTLEGVEAGRRKKALQSSYEAQFSTSPDNKQKPAVFRYRKLRDLPCSGVLNNSALKCLESWIELKDDGTYQELMLACLRSLAASVNLNRQAVSEQKKQYVWSDHTRLLKAHRIDCVAPKLRSLSSATQRARVRNVTPKKADTSMDTKIFSKDVLERRRLALMRGAGAITSWMGASGKQNSSYQDTYVTYFTRYHQPPPKDFHTSISLGRMIPRPSLVSYL